MYRLTTSPLTISGVYKHGWELYKASLQYVIVWSLIVAIIHVIPNLFRFVGFYHRDITGQLSFSWVGLVIFLILLIAETFFLAIFFYNIYSVAKKQKVNTLETLDVAKKQLWHLYIAMIIYTTMLHIGIFLLIVPAVFFSILFFMVLPYVLLENLTIYNSFESSARLVWGHWWQTFFVLTVPYVLIYMIRHLFKFPAYHGDWSLLVDVVVLSLGMPYFYSVLLIQFNNLKIIKSLPEPISQSPRGAQND